MGTSPSDWQALAACGVVDRVELAFFLGGDLAFVFDGILIARRAYLDGMVFGFGLISLLLFRFERQFSR